MVDPSLTIMFLAFFSERVGRSVHDFLRFLSCFSVGKLPHVKCGHPHGGESGERCKNEKPKKTYARVERRLGKAKDEFFYG